MRIDRHEALALLTMDAGKGNAMGPAFIAELADLIGQVEESDADALVLTGGGKMFSVGLMLPELVKLDRDGMRRFMVDFDNTMFRVFKLPIPTVAAVNGHAIAGGCVLSTMCDRSMLAKGRGKIGLIEVTLGIGLPAAISAVLELRVPKASFFPIAFEGGLFDGPRALELGLVHEIVPADELLAMATAKAKALAGLGRHGYAHIKQGLQAATVARIVATQEASIEGWLDTWESETARARIGAAVAKLNGG